MVANEATEAPPAEWNEASSGKSTSSTWGCFLKHEPKQFIVPFSLFFKLEVAFSQQGSRVFWRSSNLFSVGQRDV